MLSKSDERILGLLVRSSGDSPLRVDEVARRLGVSTALASRRLKHLAAEGFVDRHQRSVPNGRVVEYVPRPSGLMTWLSPKEKALRSWRIRDEIDWAFPLVSTVPDQGARTSLTRMLGDLRLANLLDAHVKTAPNKNKISAFQGLTVLLYGSTARGDARQDSDVDILVFHAEDNAPRLEQIRLAVAEASIESPRTIQANYVHWDFKEKQLPPWIHRTVQAEGFIVFDGLRTKDIRVPATVRTYLEGEPPVSDTQGLLEGAKEWLEGARMNHKAGRKHAAFECYRQAAELAGKILLARSTGTYPREHDISGALAHAKLMPEGVKAGQLKDFLLEFTRGTYAFDRPIHEAELQNAKRIAERMMAAATT